MASGQSHDRGHEQGADDGRVENDGECQADADHLQGGQVRGGQARKTVTRMAA